MGGAVRRGGEPREQYVTGRGMAGPQRMLVCASGLTRSIWSYSLAGILNGNVWLSKPEAPHRVGGVDGDDVLDARHRDLQRDARRCSCVADAADSPYCALLHRPLRFVDARDGDRWRSGTHVGSRPCAASGSAPSRWKLGNVGTLIDGSVQVDEAAATRHADAATAPAANNARRDMSPLPMNILDDAEHHPRDAAGGQQQRTELGAARRGRGSISRCRAH